MNTIRFEEAIKRVYSDRKSKDKIGVLAEKNLHAVIKEYISDKKDSQEVKVGNYYADVLVDNIIYEVQTRNFDKLRKKLDYFLLDHKVCIVYPLINKKWIIWEDKDKGEVIEKRLSPKKGKLQDIFIELYKIKRYLDNSNLTIKILLIDLEETRYQDGFGKQNRRRATKINNYPLGLYNEVDLNSIEEYKVFIPKNIDYPFTSKDFAKEAGASIRTSQIALNILNHLGIVERVRKDKNEYIYLLKQNDKIEQ